MNFTTKLELGVLALLWCSGNQEEKARFFCKLANPNGDEFITHTDKEVKFIFKKLFYFSKDLTDKYLNHKKKIMESAASVIKGLETPGGGYYEG